MMVGYGYKLFEENKDGKLFPLFIGKSEETPVGVWVHAENIPTNGFANRPGWHIGDIPDAPWLKGYDGSDVGCYHSRFKNGRRVWCLVAYNATKCYDDIVKDLPKKCFVDHIPEDGYYFFRETGNRTWCITSDIMIVRKISEYERLDILKRNNYDEVAAYAKYKVALEKRIVS